MGGPELTFFCNAALYGQPAPLEIEVAANPDELAFIRTSLRGWLGQAGVDSEQSLNVLIATGEAVSNAIEHGHRGQPDGSVWLRAIVFADRLHLTITDTGSWKPPEPILNSHRGRGIALMRALMHEVTIQSRPSGTTVHLHARIA